MASTSILFGELIVQMMKSYNKYLITRFSKQKSEKRIMLNYSIKFSKNLFSILANLFIRLCVTYDHILLTSTSINKVIKH